MSSPCEDEVAAAGGDLFTKGEARSLLAAIEARAAELQSRDGLPWHDAMDQAARDIRDANDYATAAKRKQALVNLRTRIETDRSIEAKATELGAKLRGDKGPDLATAIRSELTKINTPVKGGRFSTEASRDTRVNRYLNTLVRALKSQGVLAYAGKRASAQNIALELWERSQASAGRRGNPGVTGDALAGQAADAIHAVQAQSRETLNRLGADVGQLAGYVTRTVHDSNAIRRAGADAWIDFVQARLDPARHEDLIASRGALRQLWTNFVANDHQVDTDLSGVAEDPFRPGGVNVADQASHSLVLHMKDGQSWFDYQQKFGRGTLMQQITETLRRSAQQEALLERWGTNPRLQFEATIDRMVGKYKNAAVDSASDLQRRKGELVNLFNGLDGTSTRPANQMLADYANGLRLWISMAKLGLVALTHVGALHIKAQNLQYHGASAFESWGNVLSSFAKQRGRGMDRDLADELLAGMEGMHGSLLSQFSLNDSAPGVMTSIADFYFKATGLTPVIDWQKAGSGRVISRVLGRALDQGFDQLPRQVQRGLTGAGISPAEWDVLRQAPQHFTMPDGRQFLTPAAAMKAPHEAIAGLMGDMVPSAAQLAGRREDLALKLHAYYQDVMDASIVKPGIGDRLLTSGTQAGTPGGEAMRFIMQFKTWPIAAFRQQFGRLRYGEMSGGEIASNVFQTVIGGLALGYGVMTLKDLIQGKEPRPPGDSKTWFAAMMQSGGFGILGDYLFGQYGRFGQSPAETALGPVLGQGLAETMHLWNDLKGYGFGDPKESKLASKDIGPEMLRITAGNLPVLNMHFVRAAMNYLFLYSLQESLNPGYLARHEKQLKADTGQTMWLSPSQNHLHAFGR